MYIKRAPLGQSNLTFRKRGHRYPPLLAILYVILLAASLYGIVSADQLRPRLVDFIEAPPARVSSNKLVQIADKLFHKGDLDGAATYYRRAVQADPENIDLLTQYARVLTMANRLPDALAIADRAIQIAPEDPRPYAAKARVLDWQQNYQDSVLLALKSLEFDPNYAPAHAYLAEAYADLGRLRQAREQAELAIELDPYNVDARRNYAYVLEHYGDYPGAIQQYLQALKLEPNMLDLWYGLARNYRGAQRYDEAITAFTEVARRTPTDPLVYVEMGKTYFEIREDDAAQENLEHAVELVCKECPLYTDVDILKPGFFDRPRTKLPDKIYMPAWSRLGQVYFTRKNHESALAILEEAIACGEQSACGQTPKDIPIESYYVTASAYFYLDRCELGVVRAHSALDIYVNEKREDPNALRSILCVFTLCRDAADHPVAYQGAGFSNGFPDGYTEPDCVIKRAGAGTSATPTPPAP